jgi:hypothetical protein
MSFRITKKRKIQAWIDETVALINITLMGKEIPIDITKLPSQLQERIAFHAEKQNSSPIFSTTRPPFSTAFPNISEEERDRIRKILES